MRSWGAEGDMAGGRGTETGGEDGVWWGGNSTKSVGGKGTEKGKAKGQGWCSTGSRDGMPSVRAQTQGIVFPFAT